MKFNRREEHKTIVDNEKGLKRLKRLVLKEGYRFQSRHRQIDKY